MKLWIKDGVPSLTISREEAQCYATYSFSRLINAPSSDIEVTLRAVRPGEASILEQLAGDWPKDENEITITPHPDAIGILGRVGR